jgi:hypothetical protein
MSYIAMLKNGNPNHAILGFPYNTVVERYWQGIDKLEAETVTDDMPDGIKYMISLSVVFAVIGGELTTLALNNPVFKQQQQEQNSG